MLNKKISFILRLSLLVLVLSVFGSSLCAGLYAKDNKQLEQRTLSEVMCTETDCYFPHKEPSKEDIQVVGKIDWDKKHNLILNTRKSIIFDKKAKITISSDASLILKAGMEPGDKDIYDGTVKFEGDIPQIETKGSGMVKVYYNPTKGKEKHKYHNPTIYSDKLSGVKFKAYMLVNDVYDLQGITACLYCAYALSQDIDAESTRKWNDGKGFFPIKEWNAKDPIPFSGVFDGDNHTIKDLYINRPEENMVGLFGDVTGVNMYRSLLKDFTVKDSFISGNNCVGVVIGQATGVEISNINVINTKIYGNEDVSGELGGCVLVNKHSQVSAQNVTVYVNGTPQKDPKLFGTCIRCEDASNKEDPAVKNGKESKENKEKPQ